MFFINKLGIIILNNLLSIKNYFRMENFTSDNYYKFEAKLKAVMEDLLKKSIDGFYIENSNGDKTVCQYHRRKFIKKQLNK